MSEVIAGEAPGRKISQRRGQKTYDALIATGFKLLEHRELESLPIAELAQKAGYSVGAFYARFRSKDEFFDAMIAHHLKQRKTARDRIFATAADDTLISELIEDLVTSYWKRRRFWRAALMRSMRDPEFWEPIRRHGHDLANALIARIAKQRKLPEAAETNIRFAFQIALGTINNTIINRPGPIFMGQELFVKNLARAFRLVSGYDELVGIGPSRRS
jgi:AcrR family transcriptional regulator